jgi:hypothetical protein
VGRKCGLTINNGWRQEWQFAFSTLKTRVAARDQKCKQMPKVRTRADRSNRDRIYNLCGFLVICSCVLVLRIKNNEW